MKAQAGRWLRTRMTTVFGILIVLASVVGTVWAEEKPGKEKGPGAAEHKGVGKGLREETVALAEEQCPDLLELRREADEIWGKYHAVATAFGSKARSRADKILPRARGVLRNLIRELERDYKSEVQPFERERAKLKDAEADLLEKMDKKLERGRDVEDLQKELDELGAELERIEDAMELLQEVGLPKYDAGDPILLVLDAVVKLGEREERTLARFLKRDREMVEARIKVADLRADLQAARAGEDGDKDAVPRLERDCERAEEDLTKILEDVWEPYAEDLEEMEEEMAELKEKVERFEGRRSAARYEQELSALGNRKKQLDDVAKLLKLLAKGTAAEVLWQRGEDDEKKRK